MMWRRDEIRPPDHRFTTELLERAVTRAVADVHAPLPKQLGDPKQTVRWGTQLDIQHVAQGDVRGQIAGYLAKYSTKSTEQAGGLLHPITREDIDTAKVSEHIRRHLRAAFALHDKMIAAINADERAECMNRPAPAPATSNQPNAIVLRVLAAMSSDERVRIRLHDTSQHTGQITRRTNTGLVLDTAAEIALADVRVIAAAPPPAPKPHRRDRRLAGCAHTLGYRGHCLTKSRQYSTTFKDLRQARADHVRAQLLAHGNASQRALAQTNTDERITAFELVGVGHITTADAYLAAQAAARARENRQLAREALYDHHNRGREHQCQAPQNLTRAA
jgi:hypothetical protein